MKLAPRGVALSTDSVGAQVGARESSSCQRRIPACFRTRTGGRAALTRVKSPFDPARIVKRLRALTRIDDICAAKNAEYAPTEGRSRAPGP